MLYATLRGAALSWSGSVRGHLHTAVQRDEVPQAYYKRHFVAPVAAKTIAVFVQTKGGKHCLLSVAGESGLFGQALLHHLAIAVREAFSVTFVQAACASLV